MTILKRPQVVLDAFEGIRSGQGMTHSTVDVTKTATMTQGTLLVAAGTEAVDADITSGAAVYVIDDLQILETEVGNGLTLSAVSNLDKVLFRGEALNLSGVPLTAAQLTAFGVKFQ